MATMCSEEGIYTINSIYDSQDFGSKRQLNSVRDINEGTEQNSSKKFNSLLTSLPATTNNMKAIVIFIFDLIIAALVIGLSMVVNMNLIPSNQGGFFCNDPKISYKYQGDTVTNKMLVMVSLLVPLLFMFACELCAFSSTDVYKTPSRKRKILISMIRSLYRYREYATGLVLLLVIVGVGKLVFGEPRPHFLDTCKPDAAVNCTDSSMYIDEYICTNKDFSEYFIRDSVQSFPSGHSAVSAYTGLFLVWFLHKKFSTKNSWVLIPFFQMLCFLWIFITPLTRITDHRHHWWDTLAGSVLGSLCAVYTIHHIICDSFKNNKCTDKPLKSVPNGHILNGNRRQSLIKRLLSNTSTTSYNDSDKELSDVRAFK